MALPTLTPREREEALAKPPQQEPPANTSSRRSRGGEQTIAEVLDRAKTDPVVGRTRVTELLKSLPGYGPAK